jgi:hypothetical protein
LPGTFDIAAVELLRTFNLEEGFTMKKFLFVLILFSLFVGFGYSQEAKISVRFLQRYTGNPADVPRFCEEFFQDLALREGLTYTRIGKNHPAYDLSVSTTFNLLVERADLRNRDNSIYSVTIDNGVMQIIALYYFNIDLPTHFIGMLQ